MKLLPFLLLPLFFLPLADAKDWPWWRGTERTGIADPEQKPPLKFSPSENVKWVVDVPGRGHGSPIIVGNRVYLQTADEKEKTQSVLCFDRESGKQVWSTEVHRGSLPKTNKKASHASSTPACDGERIYVNFVHGDAAYTTALDLDGKQLWQTELCKYKVHQGYGSSPAPYNDLLLVSADNKKAGVIAALDPATGKEKWKVERPRKPNYPSPVVLTAAGKPQLFMSGCDLVTSLDPLTGKTLWEMKGATTECVTSGVTDGKHVFTSGGYPRNHVSAYTADGSNKLVWEAKDRVYVPSMIVRDGYLYAVLDAGLATCWKSDTGERMWKERLGGDFSSSPVMVGDRIYVGNERGTFYVFGTDPKTFELLAKNQLGDQVFATPVIVDHQIFARVNHLDGKRQEKLYCLETAKK